MAVEFTPLNANNINNIDTNFQRVKEAFQEVLGRNGNLPNHMNADLDMNSNDILNVNAIEVQDLIIQGDSIASIVIEAREARDEAVLAANAARLSEINAKLSELLAAEYATQAVSQGNVPIRNSIVVAGTNPVKDGIIKLIVLGEDGGVFTSIDNGTGIIFTSTSGEGATARPWYREKDVNSQRLVDSSIGADAINAAESVQIKNKLGISETGDVDLLPSVSGYETGVYDPTKALNSSGTAGQQGFHKHFSNITRDTLGRVYIAYRHADTHGVSGNTSGRLIRLDKNGGGSPSETIIIPSDPNWDVRETCIGVLPSGRVVVVWSHIPFPNQPGTYKSIYSDDRGDTWSTPTIIEAGTGGRIYGGLRLVPSPRADREHELVMPYYLNRGGAERGYYISVDGVNWARETAEGYPLITTSGVYTETSMDAVNSQVWFTVLRDDGVNDAKIAWSVDGRQSWTSFTKIGTSNSDVKAGPYLSIVRDGSGTPYVLVGLSNRLSKKIRWTWAKVTSVISRGGAAFVDFFETASTGNGYPALTDIGNGTCLYSFGNEDFGLTGSSNIGFGLLNYSQLFNGMRVRVWSPGLIGGTTPGSPTGTFSGLYTKEASGKVVCNGQIVLSSKGGVVGPLSVSNLPFPIRSQTSARGSLNIGRRAGVSLGSVSDLHGYGTNGDTTVSLYKIANTGVSTVLLDTDITDGFLMYFEYTYFTDD